MMQALTRKVSQVVGDPVLRRWLMARALGRWPGPPPFTAGRPPYLDGVTLPLPMAAQPAGLEYAELPAAEPTAPVTLPLPAETITVAPGQEDALMGRDFADTETLLGVHRFAWLPVVGHDIDPAWVGALWRAWARRFGDQEKGWAWHPYTAAERAINVLAFARRHGLPGQRADTLALLANHARAIAGRLEYFGEHNTSNHLANNGRGLFVLGLELGMDASADLGVCVLIEETRRILLPSGVLREGSSHYHLLLTRSYADAWLAARAHGRAETAELEAITRRALAVIPRLVLPGGLPLVGDVSPDCPPGHLSGLLPGGDLNSGWAGLLDEDTRQAFRALRDSCAPVAAEALLADGWLRADSARGRAFGTPRPAAGRPCRDTATRTSAASSCTSRTRRCSGTWGAAATARRATPGALRRPTTRSPSMAPTPIRPTVPTTRTGSAPKSPVSPRSSRRKRMA